MLDLTIAERMIDLHQQGKSVPHIAGELVLGESTARRYIEFLEVHGTMEFKHFYVEGKRPTFSDKELADIVEYVVETGYSADKAAILFKAERHKLAKLVGKRILEGKPLHPEAVAAVPPHINFRCREPSARRKATLPHRTFLSVSGRALEHDVPRLSSDNMFVGASNFEAHDCQQQGTDSCASELPRIGRARAPVPVWRPKKIMRNKAITEANKQQEALEKRYQEQTVNTNDSASNNASEAANCELEDCPSKKRSKALDASRPHPAREYFEKNGKAHKNVVYDPESERFDELPAEVQLRSLRRCYKDVQEENTCLKKSFALSLQELAPNLVAQNKIKMDYADMLREDFKWMKLKNILNALELTKDVYFYKPKAAEDKHAEAKRHIRELQISSGFSLGKRRMTALLREKQVYLCVPTVRRLMVETGMVPHACKAVRYNSFKKEACKNAKPNVVKRQFNPQKPRTLFTTDVTMFNVCGVKVYFAPYVDLFCNEIVAYSISLTDSVEASIKPLKHVLSLLPSKASDGKLVIFHSDQGFQYQSERYQALLEAAPNVVQSMSRVGNCYDNGAGESLFSRIKAEMFTPFRYESVDEFVQNLVAYIEYYNTERVQAGLNYMSPHNYLKQYYLEQSK